jgi:hypothetical protein
MYDCASQEPRRLPTTMDLPEVCEKDAFYELRATPARCLIKDDRLWQSRLFDEICQRVASAHQAHLLSRTRSIFALPPRSPPSVVPDILSPSAVNSHFANATVRPGRGCVVSVIRFPFTIPSSGC